VAEQAKKKNAIQRRGRVALLLDGQS